MTGFRCELLSIDQLDGLARDLLLAPGIPASAARRSLHRDLYLDTPDDSLRQRGVTCRFRTVADGSSALTLRIPASNGKGVTRLTARTSGVDVGEVLRANNAVVRALRGLTNPSALEVRVDVEVDRLTRSASPGWLRRPRLTVHLDRVTARRHGTSATFLQLCAHPRRGGDAALQALSRAVQDQHGLRESSVGPRERAELALKWARLDGAAGNSTYSDRAHRAAIAPGDAPMPEFLNAEVSLLRFQERVLALAEDENTPVGERLRFLSIVAANLDEFFMVRIAGLHREARDSGEEAADDGLTSADELDEIAGAVERIMARQSDCLHACLQVLAAHDIHLRAWRELAPPLQQALRREFEDRIQPLLTPFAMTLSPGHPLPRLSHLSLAIAATVRPRSSGPPRYVELELPPTLPRFYSVADGSRCAMITLEDVVRGNLELLYPDSVVEQAFTFRVTRSAELDLDEANADDLLAEVARASAARGSGAAVRVEVERGMPPQLRALLLEDIRRERLDGGSSGVTDVVEVGGLLDLRRLVELPLPADPGMRYPAFRTARPFTREQSVFDAIRGGDRLVHHPFESFSDTVVRFAREAADDPHVLAIKTTLYRVGNPSPIADALVDAARAGKSVTAFVELKARFDEDVNVAWTRALEAAGGNVIRGLVGFKNHAKLMLVVRREGDDLKRYVHVGTGNYNARSGEQYTDLSLFSTGDALTSDVAGLFNELTGRSEPPRARSQTILVAPHYLLAGIVQHIDREAAHARAGRDARITAKMNGLSDPDVVRALYRASGDGVEIDLIVRGICTLRPGVPGRSDRIRVLSVAGRFLEHSRIYRFAGGGDAKYFIGSADLRPRNLRRRVEVLAPIVLEDHRRRLDQILDHYVSRVSAWRLGADGGYTLREGVESSDAG